LATEEPNQLKTERSQIVALTINVPADLLWNNGQCGAFSDRPRMAGFPRIRVALLFRTSRNASPEIALALCGDRRDSADRRHRVGVFCLIALIETTIE